MRIIIRTFFRGLRLVLAPVVLIAEKLSTPKAAVERTPEQQAEVDRACESLALYQFRTCPFCVKVRKEIARLEDAMFEAAQNLEFEEAARLRDRLHQLKERQLALG